MGPFPYLLSFIYSHESVGNVLYMRVSSETLRLIKNYENTHEYTQEHLCTHTCTLALDIFTTVSHI